MAVFSDSGPAESAKRRALLWQAWSFTAIGFIGAIGAQMLMYGGALWGGGPIWKFVSPIHSAWALYEVLFFLFAFGPGVAAGMFACRRLRRCYRVDGASMPGAIIAALVVLILLDSYLGVVVCFNTWGT